MNNKVWVTKDSGQREEYDTGARRDVREGKGRFDLLSPIAIARLAGVYERGAAKYGDRNYEKGIPVTRFLDSALRHTFQALEGRKDEDHLAQAAWNLLSAITIQELVSRGKLPQALDDLPDYGVQSPQDQVEQAEPDHVAWGGLKWRIVDWKVTTSTTHPETDVGTFTAYTTRPKEAKGE